MSMFRGSYQACANESGGPSELELHIRSQWPTAADVLFGSGAEGDGQLCIPSHTILLFAEGEYLKYCLSSKQTRLVAFGAIPKDNVRLGMLERSLSAGDFAWKPKKGR
jgi:hypothetical protein